MGRQFDSRQSTLTQAKYFDEISSNLERLKGKQHQNAPSLPQGSHYTF